MTLNMPDTGNPAETPTLLIATITSYNEGQGLGRAWAIINHQLVKIILRMNERRKVVWDENHLGLTITDEPVNNSEPFEMFETPVALRAERRGRLLHAVVWGSVPQANLSAIAPILDAQANMYSPATS